MELSEAMRSLLMTVDALETAADSKPLALSATQLLLEEQTDNIKKHGRVQFINPGPNSGVIASLNPSVADSFAMDSSLLRVEAEREYDPSNPRDLEGIQNEFNRIVRKMSSGSPTGK